MTCTRLAGWALAGALLQAPGAFAATPERQGPVCPITPPPLSLPDGSQESGLSAEHAKLEGNVATAEGHALLQLNHQTLKAPRIQYNDKTSQASANNGLQYLRDGLYISAQRGQVNIDQHTGEFDDVHYAMTSNGARGEAKQVNAKSRTAFQLVGANYSTCPGPTKDWMLAARSIDLNRETGRGVARDATLRIHGVPVFYTPYINFPIDDKRHTGFLMPTVGYSSGSGFELSAPYYLNLAPNYDATLTPRVMSRRGFQLGGQFRYLTRHHKGTLNAQILPYDMSYGGERDLEYFHHIGQLSPHVGVEADFARVSDDDYFDDLSNDFAGVATNHLDRRLKLNSVWGDLNLSFLVQDFQTLDSGFVGWGRYQEKPYQRMPQVSLNWLTSTAPFQFGVDAQFTNFQRRDSIGAYRSDLRPRLVWGVDHGGWYADSEAAYRITYYDFNDLDNFKYGYNTVQPDRSHVTRKIPSFKSDVGLRFSRTFGNDWIQTLEPHIQYLLVGYQDQSDIPIFDADYATLNYDELFAGNRFTGIDRIGDANQLTLGVSSRIISPHSGRTVAKLELGRVTSFRDLKVGLPDSSATGYSRHGSDYVLGAMFSPSDYFTGRTVLQYDPHHSHLDRAVATTTIGARDGYQLDLGYRYYRDYRPARDIDYYRSTGDTRLVPGQFETLSQAAIGIRAPIGDQLKVIGRWNYSFKRHQNIETLAALEYQPSCCYAARVAWRHYVVHNDGRQGNSIMFQFVLRGLGNFGKPISTFTHRDLFSTKEQLRPTSSL